MPVPHLIKDMYVNKMRLILTIIAVAWGTFSVGTMLAVGEGLRLTFSKAIQCGSEALIVTPGESTRIYKGQPNHRVVEFTQEDLRYLQEFFAQDALITASAQWNNNIYYGKEGSSAAITAVDDHYTQAHPIHLLSNSRFINYQDVKFHRQVIVLGKQSAEKLFKKDENPIGKFVILANRPFLVIGVQKNSLQLFATNRIPDNYTNWIPITSYQDLTNQNHFNNFVIAPFDLLKTKNFQDQITTFLAKLKVLDSNDAGILNFIDLQDKKKKLTSFLVGLEIFLGIIGGLTLIVAGVGIANVMFISITRSTRNIGIKMAVGATPRHILLYFALEALLTTSLGGFLGLILTKLFLFLLTFLPMHSPVFEFFGNPEPILSLNVIFIVILFLGAIGFLAGIFPARKASLINPAEALRYE